MKTVGAARGRDGGGGSLAIGRCAGDVSHAGAVEGDVVTGDGGIGLRVDGAVIVDARKRLRCRYRPA